MEFTVCKRDLLKIKQVNKQINTLLEIISNAVEGKDRCYCKEKERRPILDWIVRECLLEKWN